MDPTAPPAQKWVPSLPIGDAIPAKESMPPRPPFHILDLSDRRKSSHTGGFGT